MDKKVWEMIKKRDKKTLKANFINGLRTAGYSEVDIEKFGITFNKDDKNISKQKIKDFFNINNRLPKKSSKDKIECQLGWRLSSYCSPKSKMFDPEMRLWKNSVGTTINFPYKIKQFYMEHKRLPRFSGNEFQLASNMKAIVNRGKNVEFTIWYKAIVKLSAKPAIIKSPKKDSIREIKDLILKFIDENNRMPSTKSKNSQESKLSFKIRYYTQRNEDFKSWRKQNEII